MVDDPASGRALLSDAWQLMRRRPLLFGGFGALLQLPGLLVSATLPDFEQLQTMRLEQIAQIVTQASDHTMLGLLLSWPVWVVTTAAALAEISGGADAALLFSRLPANLIAATGAFLVALAGLIAGFFLLLAPTALAAWLATAGSPRALLAQPLDHLGLFGFALANGVAALCVLLIGLIIFVQLVPAALTPGASLRTMLRRAWVVTSANFWPLNVALGLWSLLQLGLSLAAGLGGLLLNDAVGSLIGALGGAALAPLPVVCAALLEARTPHKDAGVPHVGTMVRGGARSR